MSEHNDVCPDCGADVSSVSQGLRKALETEREAAKKAQRTVKQLKDASAKHREAAADVEKKDARIAELEQALDAMTKQRDADAEELRKAQEAAAEIEPLRAENETLKADAEKAEADKAQAEKDAAITEELQKAGGNIEALMPHVRSRADAAPERELSEIITDLRNSDSFAALFRGTGQSGGGAPVDGGSGGKIINMQKSKADLKRSTMTDREKVDFQREHGLDALLDLPQ